MSAHDRNAWRSLQPGDALELGIYRVSTGCKPLDDDAMTRPIRWRILERRGDRLLLISDHILDWEAFDFEGRKWKHSYLRELLNNEYLYEWFTREERQLLCGTPDRIYLLSLDKACKYFPQPGSAAASMLQGDGADPDSIEEYWIPWWLCSPGSEPETTACVEPDGEICAAGFDSDADEFGVRPVIWIDLSRIKETTAKED